MQRKKKKKKKRTTTSRLALHRLAGFAVGVAGPCLDAFGFAAPGLTVLDLTGPSLTVLRLIGLGSTGLHSTGLGRTGLGMALQGSAFRTSTLTVLGRARRELGLAHRSARPVEDAQPPKANASVQLG